jgi:LysM repeat protein
MFDRLPIRIALLVVGAVLVWSVVARPSGAHGQKEVYTVKAYDTLWSIASSHYAGDARDAIYRIQDRNGLHGTLLVPGQRLVLP